MGIETNMKQYGLSEAIQKSADHFSDLTVLRVILQEKGINVRDSLSKQRLPVRWCAYAALVMAVVIFGAYGPGYDAVDFIYGQF